VSERDVTMRRSHFEKKLEESITHDEHTINVGGAKFKNLWSKLLSAQRY